MRSHRFSNRIPLTQEILATIATIDQFKGLWQGSLRLNPQILGRLKSWVIIASTGASTRIEGASMSDEEIARFLRGLRAKRPTNRDEQEVAGYADVLGRIFDNWNTMKLSEGWILQLHNILLQFSQKDRAHKGKYKNAPNTVVMKKRSGEHVILFDSTPHLVKAELLEAIEWTNRQLDTGAIHPLLVIANFIFELLAIHPFKDGNGRLSRALTNLLLLKTGYSYVPYVSLDAIIEQSKTEYYLALRATQKYHKTKKENIAPWVEYFLGALLEQSRRAQSLMRSDQPEKLLSEKQMQIYHFFEGNGELGVAAVSECLKDKTPLVSIKQALSRLVALKLLERIGQARSTRYRKTR